MLLRLSSNSLLLFKSSPANNRLGINILLWTAPQICCDSKDFVGTFPYKWSRLSLRCSIHLNTANYSPCTVTLQMTAEPPNSKLAFYCLWIIICSRASCIHTKCAVSKRGIKTWRVGESGWGAFKPDRYVIRADLSPEVTLIWMHGLKTFAYVLEDLGKW